VRAISLARLLVALNAGLLVLALAGTTLHAGRLLGRATDRGARQRTSLAAAAAQAALSEVATALDTSARLLGQRPTLARLVREGRTAEAAAFLDRFRETSGLDGCAVVRDGATWIANGDGTDWPRLVAGAPVPALAATAPLSGESGVTAWVARRIGPELERELSARAGLPVRLVLRSADAAGGAHVDVGSVVTRADDAGFYVATLGLPASSSIDRLEVRLSMAEVRAERRSALRVLAAWFVAAALIGGAGSLLVARAVARPIERLGRSAIRIGSGDLQTVVRPERVAELGALATSMESMRGRLLHLTSELRRRQGEAEAILSGIVEGVLAVDAERRIRYLNPRAAALLGLAPDAARGRFCGDVLQPRGPDGQRPCDEDCPIVHARSRGRARAVEQIAPLGGESRTVVITGAAPSEGQQILLLRAETESEATRRLRDAVLAHISHEFKTPLAAQLASIEMLRDRLRGPGTGESATLVAALERSTLRLTRLVDNLLESARIEAGQRSIRRHPLSLEQVVGEAAESMAPLLDQRRQRLEVDLPRPLPEVEGDAPRLVQVFVNLLANANKYAPPDSRIRVAGRVEPQWVALWVEDQGPGLPDLPDELLFARFTRALGEEPEESGLGLGLWIARSIVERHGGTIEPVRHAGGAWMAVTLPRKATADRQPAPGEEA